MLNVLFVWIIMKLDSLCCLSILAAIVSGIALVVTFIFSKVDFEVGLNDSVFRTKEAMESVKKTLNLWVKRCFRVFIPALLLGVFLPNTFQGAVLATTYFVSTNPTIQDRLPKEFDDLYTLSKEYVKTKVSEMKLAAEQAKKREK